MIEAKAALTDGLGSFTIDSIQVGQPGPDEVLVKMKAAGICHTDWDSLNWKERFTWNDHMILGHEGAGIIESVGKNVDHLNIGDHVLLNWAIPCRQCFQCELKNFPLCESAKHADHQLSQWKGNPVMRSFNIGTLSTHSVVKKEAVTKIPSQMNFAPAALLGCAVMTGYGSVIKAAKVDEGSSVVVIGCGGVGLNVIQGARIAGAERIIAIDLKSSRLDMARQFGATHLVQSDRSDHDLIEASQQVKNLTDGRGADYSFECTGIPALGASPLRMVRDAGVAIQVSGIEELPGLGNAAVTEPVKGVVLVNVVVTPRGTGPHGKHHAHPVILRGERVVLKRHRIRAVVIRNRVAEQGQHQFPALHGGSRRAGAR